MGAFETPILQRIRLAVGCLRGIRVFRNKFQSAPGLAAGRNWLTIAEWKYDEVSIRSRPCGREKQHMGFLPISHEKILAKTPTPPRLHHSHPTLPRPDSRFRFSGNPFFNPANLSGKSRSLRFAQRDSHAIKGPSKSTGCPKP
jgi:hypothetical protein